MKLFDGFAKKVIIIFVILACYGLIFSTGLFDIAIGYNFKIAHCEDSDKGSIYEKGTVSGYTDYNAQFEKTDYCSLDDPTKLKEYQCDLLVPNNWEPELIVCDNGCEDGACIKE